MTGFVKTADILSGKFEDGAEVKIRGWIYNSRSSGGIQFLELRDGAGVIQCTLNKRKVGEETFDKVEKFPLETSIELMCNVKEDSRAPGGWEVRVNSIGNVFVSHLNYPIVKKEQGIEFLMDNRHLYIREPKLQNIFHIRAKFLEAARDYFKNNGYTEVQTLSLIHI